MVVVEPIVPPVTNIPIMMLPPTIELLIVSTVPEIEPVKVAVLVAVVAPGNPNVA